MADPINTIVDEIRLSEGAGFIEVFNDSLYCSIGPIRRIDLRSKAIGAIAPGTNSGPIALVDFHRPIDLPPDVAGAGAPDRRIYVAIHDGRVGEIIPALFDQFTPFKVTPSFRHTPFIARMVGANSGKYLYFHDWDTLTIGIVDLDAGPRTVGSIQLDSAALGMVISPDDRFIYTAHQFDNVVSVIDTSMSPPSVRTVPVVNGPYGLALSADGKRLFVAQKGDSASSDPSDLGNGTLTVLDTMTMQGSWLYTGDSSIAVAVNVAGTRAYVLNSNGNTVSVVDVTSSPVVIDTITGFSNPGDLCLSADERHLYVAQFGDSSAGAQPGIAVVAI